MEKQFGWSYHQKVKRQRELNNWLSKVGSWIVFLILTTAIIVIIDGLTN